MEKRVFNVESALSHAPLGKETQYIGRQEAHCLSWEEAKAEARRFADLNHGLSFSAVERIQGDCVTLATLIRYQTFQRDSTGNLRITEERGTSYLLSKGKNA